jgi:hypothetical protein
MKTLINTKRLRKLDGGVGVNLKTDLGGELGDASLADLIRVLIIRMPIDQLKMGDVYCGTKILGLAEDCKENLELEDGDFDWLEQAVKAYAPKIFGMNALYLAQAMNEAKEGLGDER